MNDQPAFPADEPLLPAAGCTCAICRGIRLAIEATMDKAAGDNQTAQDETK